MTKEHTFVVVIRDERHDRQWDESQIREAMTHMYAFDFLGDSYDPPARMETRKLTRAEYLYVARRAVLGPAQTSDEHLLAWGSMIAAEQAGTTLVHADGTSEVVYPPISEAEAQQMAHWYDEAAHYWPAPDAHRPPDERNQWMLDYFNRRKAGIDPLTAISMADEMAAMARAYAARDPLMGILVDRTGERDICLYCEQDIEAHKSDIVEGGYVWMDRGGNLNCQSGLNKGGPHTPPVTVTMAEATGADRNEDLYDGYEGEYGGGRTEPHADLQGGRE